MSFLYQFSHNHKSVLRLLKKARRIIKYRVGIESEPAQPTISTDVLELLDPNSDFDVHFLGTTERAKGVCICIHTDSGPTIVIDTGHNETAGPNAAYLKSIGVETIDLLVITHFHGDHVGGCATFSAEFDIQRAVSPPFTLRDDYRAQTETALDPLQIEPVSAGDPLTVDDIELEILAPVRKYEYRENNNSLVCKLTLHNTTFLFTGDAELEAEYDLLKQDIDLSADILQVGRHGHRTSSTPHFLSATTPNHGIIISEYADKSSASHPAVRDRLKQISNTECYETSIVGTVVIQVFPDHYDTVVEY